MSDDLKGFFYLVSAVCFILALRGLSSPESARKGNILGVTGMLIAAGVTLLDPSILSFELIISGALIGGAIGTFIALRIQMTALPQLVACFHSLVGLAAVFVAVAAFFEPELYGIGTKGDIKVDSLIEMSLGTVIGAVTFSGSIVAFAKLQELVKGAPITFKGQHSINAVLGLLLLIFVIIIPIGGADMPVVVSMLNSYSGWAAAGIGFTLSNTALIVTGALVGSSGAILSYIMCKGMNRSIFNVLLGGFGSGPEVGSTSRVETERAVKSGSGEDASFIMKNASRVIIVPGYGMAVAQAQHALREMSDLLKREGVEVSYAIHPVAGRMPGHMNVLLAEANVPYDEVFELEEINSEFPKADVAFVIGANDVTNPAAKTDPSSPIYGMPILEVENADTVLFLKRSMASGYAGVDNELFFRDNTMMLFGDAKATTNAIVQSLGQ